MRVTRPWNSTSGSLGRRQGDGRLGVAWKYAWPSIAVDGGGNVTIVWVDERNGDPDLYSAYSAAISATWSSHVRVNDDASGQWQVIPDIAVETSGTAHAGWFDRRDGDGVCHRAVTIGGVGATVYGGSPPS